MSDLMQKLAMSKKIMDKHNEVSKGASFRNSLRITENVNAKYNIPSEVLSECAPQQEPKIQDTITQLKP